MDMQDIEVFLAAVKTGSLAGASRQLGMLPMAATRRLGSLEKELRVRLLHRTTRSLALTPEGETFLPYAQALLDNEREALARLHSGATAATGLLRVSIPVAFGLKFVAPMVPGLLQENPDLRIALDMTDSLPDLVATGTDLAIRIARLRDSGLIAQKLADNPRVIVASPDYLARNGRPVSPEALADHLCLPLEGSSHWTFLSGEKELHIRVANRFTATSIEGCHVACLAGAGIALLSEWNVADDIAAGRLVRVDFANAVPEPIHIWAVYPTTKLVPQRVRIFIAELRRALAAAGLPAARG